MSRTGGPERARARYRAIPGPWRVVVLADPQGLSVRAISAATAPRPGLRGSRPGPHAPASRAPGRSARPVPAPRLVDLSTCPTARGGAWSAGSAPTSPQRPSDAIPSTPTSTTRRPGSQPPGRRRPRGRNTSPPAPSHCPDLSRRSAGTRRRRDRRPAASGRPRLGSSGPRPPRRPATDPRRAHR